VLRVEGLRELKFAAAAFGQADTATRRGIRDAVRRFSPVLQREVVVSAAARGPIEMAIAQSAKLTANTRGLVATFGSTGTFRGEPLRNLAAPFEFGGSQERWERYLSRQRQSKKAMQVTRRAQRQIPKRRRDGWFIFPAVADATPVLVAMWVEAITEAVRGGR